MQTEMRKAVYPMKMERLIGILSILLQREEVTAPELAEQFEVSRRTIQRDIESLCRAGIPISTAQGAGGGISIMEGYRVDRTGAYRPGDAGHPGRPQESGQRQRHPALRTVDGKAVRRDRRAGERRCPYAHRPLLLV